MRALKIVVIVMGVMLIVGVVALGVGIAYRVNHPRSTTRSTESAVISVGAARHHVTLPSGAKIIGVQNEGVNVLIRLGLADGGEELLLVDWRSGATLATLDLK